MSIESRDLVEMLKGTSYGALPQEAKHIETVIDTIWRGNIVASIDSERSTFLRDVVDKYIDYLDPERVSRIKELDFYGVAVPVADAIARIDAQRQQIIVFDGLLQLIGAYGDLMAAITLLSLVRPSRTVSINGISTPELDAYTEAGFAILAHCVETGVLAVEFRRILGPQARQRVDVAHAGAVLFVLAHEAGHLHLGHLNADCAFTSERAYAALAVQESLSPQQERELAADAFAADCFRRDNRYVFFPSVLMFLGPFSFIEALGRPADSTHPLSVNRSAQLANILAPNPTYNAVFTEIVENRAEALFALAPYRKQVRNRSLQDRMRNYMPIARAQAIIETIETTVRAEIGFLDDTEASDIARKEILPNLSQRNPENLTEPIG